MSGEGTKWPASFVEVAVHVANATPIASDAPTTSIKSGTAHLCIADPLGRRLTSHEGWLADTLATHPPMAKRISILKGMGYAQLKHEGGAIP